MQAMKPLVIVQQFHNMYNNAFSFRGVWVFLINSCSQVKIHMWCTLMVYLKVY